MLYKLWWEKTSEALSERLSSNCTLGTTTVIWRKISVSSAAPRKHWEWLTLLFLHFWVHSLVFGVTKREVHIGPSAQAHKQICVIVWLTNKEKSILLGKKWPTKPQQLVDVDIWHLFYFKWMKWGSHFKQEAAQIIGWLW